jgi:drug/metabolite transporter (DMT)-like permease
VNVLVAAFIALLGNFLLSLGMVLQKRNVAWIGAADKKVPAYRRARSGWILGFALMNLAPIFNYFALMGLPANVVSALIGANVAFTALLAAFFLKEGLGKRRLAFILLLFAALMVAGLSGGSGPGEEFKSREFFVFFALPLVAAGLVLALRAKKKGKGLAVLIAAVSGALGGYMVLAMRAVQLASGAHFLAWFTTPYLYIYLASGLVSFSLVQFAYKDGEMQSVAPAYYGMQVLWPAIASYAVLGFPFDPIQASAFVGIAFCIVMIARE